jgi:uncharacterized protein (DUF58 family)
MLSLGSLSDLQSQLEGEHAGAVRAQFAELTDYRGYQPGDDMRLIDWNAYARLNELVVRTSSAHEGLLLTLGVDCSASMAVPGGAKLWQAKRLAAAFGAVALLHSDAVRVCALADGTAWPMPVLSGRTAIGALLDELEWLPPGGATDLGASVRAGQLAAASYGPGPLVLLSDLLIPQSDPVDWLGPGCTVVHVTDPADAGPADSGVIELLDSETGEVVTATVTPALRRAYADRFEARCAGLAAACAAAGGRYIRTSTATPPADVLFGPARPLFAG